MVRQLAALVLMIGLVGGGATLVAQEERTDEGSSIRPIGGLAFVDEVQVTVVNIVAYVTDKSGAAVTDLTSDDFKIYQDGEERPISNFQLYTEDLIRSYYQAQEGAVPEPTALPEETEQLSEIQPVWMVIFVDNDNLKPLDRNRVFGQLRSFIRDNTEPPVKMMVVNNNHSLKIVQEFTDNPDRVLASLDELKMTTGGRQSRDSARADIYDEMERFTQDQSSSRNASLQRTRSLTVGFAEEEQNNLQFTLGTIREAVNLLAGLPGKKMILYVSNGLPMVPGIDMYYAMANAFDEPGMVTEGMRYSQTRQFDSLVQNANAQGVTFYTISAGGLQNVSMGSAEYHGPRDTTAVAMEQSNYLDSLRFMADETGGVAIFNTNDIRTRLDRVEQDFYSYYSIGYNLQTTGSDKVHQIKLTIPDHPDYKIRYRRRFVEKSLESRVQDKVLTGLVIPIEENPLQIMVETGDQAPASSDHWTVPFKLSFPRRNIALLPEGDEYVGRVSLFIAARDSGGKQSDVVRQEHEVRIPAADYEDAQRQRFTIQASLLMESGSFKVSAGLYDHVTRQSSFTTSSVIVSK